MAELRYKIEFFSPWHCGSGMSGGDDADFTPIVDAEGFPFIPGRTLKGLFREAAEVLFDQEFVKQIFGKPTVRNGESDSGCTSWSNAILSQATRNAIKTEGTTAFLRDARYQVAMEENGQTKDKSMRRGEYNIPMTLYATIGAVPKDCREKLQDCMGYIKEMGLQRSRGFGRCKITPCTAPQQADNNQQLPQNFSARRYDFRCHFLSSVILNSSAATEGENDTLEYIPGSNFLGMAAQIYSSYTPKDAFTIFHSGKVRFGNAYPLENNNGRYAASLPCPATWYVPKGQSPANGGRIYPYPYSQDIQMTLQPKQVRGGFFVPNAGNPHLVNQKTEKRFSLKSAYDSEQRHAEDSQMFGYTALEPGSDWGFSVTFDMDITDEIVEKVVTSLVGQKRLGRSKSAQYGSVEISWVQNGLAMNPGKPTERNAAGKSLYLLYAKSSLAFVDDNGAFTLEPPVTKLGFDSSAAIDWERTQVRCHQYCPWNGKRKSRDAERTVILPGSVIAVKSDTPPNQACIDKGVGLFLSEGFGEVLCNPAFLEAEKCPANVNPVGNAPANDNLPKDEGLVRHVDSVKKYNENIQKIYEGVQKFVEKHGTSPITASQWGAVRAIVQQMTAFGAADETNDKRLHEALFAQEDPGERLDYVEIIKNSRASHAHHPGFLKHGKAAEKWKNSKMADDLDSALQNANAQFGDDALLIFAELLAAEMAKRAQKKSARN